MRSRLKSEGDCDEQVAQTQTQERWAGRREEIWVSYIRESVEVMMRSISDNHK